MRRRQTRTHTRGRGAYGECSGYVGGQEGGHGGLGTWRGLSHLGLTGLGGWVTTGHAARGHRGRRNSLSPFSSSLDESIPARQTPRGVKSAPARQRLLTAGCCGCIYPFSSVRSNGSASFSPCLRREKGGRKTKNKTGVQQQQPVLGMKRWVTSGAPRCRTNSNTALLLAPAS